MPLPVARCVPAGADAERQLVLRIRGGEEAAIMEFAARCRALLLRLARRASLDADDCEDVVSAVVEKTALALARSVAVPRSLDAYVARCKTSW